MNCARGRLRLVANDPLIDQMIQNFRIALSFFIQEILVTRQLSHIAQQNDVRVHASGDPVDNFLRGSPHRQS